MTYKGMAVESSCRKFLDAIALKIASHYNFHWHYRHNPTLGDVFHAMDTNEWEFTKKFGRQITTMSLPDFFERNQWEELRTLNSESTSRIHNGRVPTTKHGKPFIVLPDGYFNSQRVHIMKSIARQANLVFYLDEFIVKQETCLSESSAVESSYSP